MRYRKILLSMGLIAVSASALWWASSRSVGSQDREEPNQAPPRPIPTVIVKPIPEAQTREFPGKVRASQRVQLAFSVSGLIVELNALEGRVVRKGEVIAQLDQRDYQNAFDAAKANFTDAKQRFDRTNELRKQKVVAEAEFDRAKASLDIAAAELRIREKALSDTTLNAPFDGLIAARYVENHEHVDAKKAIVSIQDITRVEIVLQVPESLLAHGGAKGLRDITVRIEADGERWFDAALREFSAQADPATRTYELVLAMEPPKDIEVLPGMTTTVRAQVQCRAPVTEQKDGVTLVPVAAVVGAPDGKSYVWLIDEEGGHPHRVPVVIGNLREDGLEIRSGLTPGQRIATAGVHSLDESMTVRPMRQGAEGLEG